MDRIRHGSRLISFAMGVLLAGCGRDGPERVMVEGEVTFQNKKVSNGDILFYPLDASSGPASGAAIKDGVYVVDAKGGVPVGRHRVEIRGFRSSTNMDASSAQAPSSPEKGGARIQYISPRFSGPASELTATIHGDNPRITLDFHLE